METNETNEQIRAREERIAAEHGPAGGVYSRFIKSPAQDDAPQHATDQQQLAPLNVLTEDNIVLNMERVSDVLTDGAHLYDAVTCHMSNEQISECNRILKENAPYPTARGTLKWLRLAPGEPSLSRYLPIAPLARRARVMAQVQAAGEREQEKKQTLQEWTRSNEALRQALLARLGLQVPAEHVLPAPADYKRHDNSSANTVRVEFEGLVFTLNTDYPQQELYVLMASEFYQLDPRHKVDPRQSTKGDAAWRHVKNLADLGQWLQALQDEEEAKS